LILGALSEGVPEKVKGLIGIAHSNCERLILLINDILDIDKIAAGKMRFNLKKESVDSLLQHAVEANLGFAEKYKVGLVSAEMESGLYIETDAGRFAQVMTNLISNAIKFSPEGEDVKVRGEKKGNRLRIEVIDRGPGISMEFQSKIFGKFSQADASGTRATGGTGLGLHITREIVMKLGGKIGFDSTPGEGATFWLSFPLVQGDAAPIDPQVKDWSEGGTLPKATATIPRILHVEDDIDFTHVLSTGLHGRAEIVGANNIGQAKTLLAKESFQLILLDLNFHDGSGNEILDFRDSLPGDRIPTVIISVDTPEVELSERVTSTLIKSLTPEAKMIQVIEELLNQQSGVNDVE
jgi:CheY-like chemotaxis protein